MKFSHVPFGVQEQRRRYGPAKKGGKWYRRVVEAAECFMARWHKDEAESSWLRHAAEDA